jgi:ATP-dependent Lon protease
MSHYFHYDNNLIRDVFGHLSIDKGRAASSQINAQGIPSFVGEWLLDKVIPGSGSLTTSDAHKLNDFLNTAFPRKDDKNLIHFQLSDGETKKIIALMQVRIKIENGGKLSTDPHASIPALSFSNLPIAVDIVRKHEMLLRHGVWGKITLEKTDESQVEVLDFEPFQSSRIDWDIYYNHRRQFQTSQWRDLMICSMGINPEHPSLTTTAKTWILARLLPLVEPNFHIMELAPKGTGKSFFYENVSSKVTLVGGGKITPAQLFINANTKEVGLLARNDVVVLDEVQSLTFDNPDEIIGTLKTYLASNRYNRSGYADITSDCSLVMLANIELDMNLKPINEDFLSKIYLIFCTKQPF